MIHSIHAAGNIPGQMVAGAGEGFFCGAPKTLENKFNSSSASSRLVAA